mmetsp:Transcript_85571/g.237152  ORF Transcript_85571/g.237152 Transcript_85571/m.237152 type:complete len:81 (+) Transcript_85571:150-392(+)
MGIVTSWASWDTALPLPGCEQLLHLPFLTTPDPLPSATIWWASPGRLAVVLCADPATLQALKAHPAIGPPVLAEQDGGTF